MQVCITTYNEADNIEGLLNALIELGYEPIVYDGASTDGTIEILLGMKVSGLSATNRMSIKECLMESWRFSKGDRIVQMDAGWSHYPQEIEKLLKSDADIVIGSRFVNGSTNLQGWRRKFVSKAYGFFCRLFTGLQVQDWTSGFRVFSREAVEFLLKQSYHGEMNGWQAEVLAKANGHFTIEEVPITYTPSSSSFGLRVMWDGFKSLFNIFHHIGRK